MWDEKINVKPFIWHEWIISHDMTLSKSKVGHISLIALIKKMCGFFQFYLEGVDLKLFQYPRKLDPTFKKNRVWIQPLIKNPDPNPTYSQI